MAKESKPAADTFAVEVEPAIVTNAPETTAPVEKWANDLAVPDWKFAAAKTLAKCPFGRELTRAAFEKMIADVDAVVCR